MNTPLGQFTSGDRGKQDDEGFQNSNNVVKQPKTLASSSSMWNRQQPRGLPSEYRGERENVANMFAAMALPEVPVFNDPQGRRFEDFLRSFEMKYLNLGLTDEMAIHLMASKLSGYPKAVFKALPKDISKGRYVCRLRGRTGRKIRKE